MNLYLHCPSFRARSLKLWLAILTIALSILPATSWQVVGQKVTNEQSANRAEPARAIPETVDRRTLEQAIGAICAERSKDPAGSSPIDDMQRRASLELNHPKAVVGAERARRLLPVARELVIEALQQLALENNFGLNRVRAAATRIRAVTNVVPDPDLRDNAAVIMNDPHTIRFGTIFLVGLPSDEGMISVLAHELTHIGDGRQNSLQGLFNLIGRRAQRLTGLRISGQKPEELACDLVGMIATRFFVTRTPGNDPLKQRLARSLEHNCVDDDETDEEHLSPRSTMRAVLALDQALVLEFIRR